MMEHDSEGVDFAILTPLPVEWTAVKARLDQPVDVPAPYPTTRGTIGQYSVAVCYPGDPAGYAAADFTRAIVMRWRPRWLVLVGVAGGFPDAGVAVGDAVIASRIFPYEYGKIHEGQFVRRDLFDTTPDRSWLAYAKLLQEQFVTGKEPWWREIRVPRPNRSRSRPRLHIGPVASGEKVMDDPGYALFVDAKKSLPRDLLAIEMEAAGVATSVVRLSAEVHLGFFMIRGISDAPQVERTEPNVVRGTVQRDLWKPYAAAAAASILKRLLTMPGAPQSGRTPNLRPPEAPDQKATNRTTSPFMVPGLPPQGVVGREGTLAEIQDALSLASQQARDVPPLALRGFGGIGKTTLAIAVGRLPVVQRYFSDGVLWTALGPRPTIRLLLESWGERLGVDLLAEPDEKACSQRVREELYHRRTFLIIDDIWDAVHARFFLVAGPHCRTLLTTREISVAFELTTPASTKPVGLLTEEASMELLQRLAPGVVEIDLAATRRLCERLDYLPLGLTLAGRFLATESLVAPRLRRLVDELIERREARLHLLQAEGRLGLTEEEPVSLQAILGMSVDRLDRIEQERFAQLAVFGCEPLTWDLEAAAAVWDCTANQAAFTVSRLIQRGLVEPRGGEYWMHGLLADYAAELLGTLKA